MGSVECEVKAPSVDVKMPSVECDVEVKAPSMKLKAPSVEVQMPSVECEVKAPSVEVKMPSVECEVEINGPKISSIACEVDVKNLGLTPEEVYIEALIAGDPVQIAEAEAGLKVQEKVRRASVDMGAK